MPDHPEPAGDVVEDLRDVFTEPSHVAAAGGTGASPVVLRFVRDLLTGQVVRQRLTLWPVPLTYWKRPAFGGSLGDLFGLAGFQFLEPQLKLFDLPGQPLRGAAELHPPQLLDFEGTQLDGELCRRQLSGRRR